MIGHKTTLLITLISAIAVHVSVSSIYEQSAKTAPLSNAVLVASINNTEPVAPLYPAMKDSFSDSTSPVLHAGKGTRPRLDLAFCIDTTGSMQGEIDTVKTKVKSMVAKLSSAQPKPIVRVGLVAYRDKGDDYVTKVFPFSDDIDKVVNDIADLNADGGGDRPEAVDAGLHAALNDLEWDADRHTAKLLFLIGDAPPHSDRHDYDWKTESLQAGARGIRINTIGCDGLEAATDEGFAVFKQIASSTNGNFQTLSYHQEVIDAAGQRETLITSGGVTYRVKPMAKDDWKTGAEALVAKGLAAPAPSLQGATNGTIGAQNRGDSNLDDVMLTGAQQLIGK